MTIANDNVIAFTSRTTATNLDTYIDQVIANHVARAALHYRAGEPGRGEFLLQRLALRLERLEAQRTPEVPQ